MKHLFSLICLLFVTFCFGQSVTHKPYFEYGDTTFYIGQKMVKRNIFFDLSNGNVIADYRTILDSLATFLVNHPTIKIEIGVHTDSRGSAKFNAPISYRRSKNLMYYLEDRVAPSRLSAIGYGETQILNHCIDGVKCTEEEHQVNRRVEFKILSTE